MTLRAVRERLVLPTGVDCLGAVTSNMVFNYRRGTAPTTAFPTSFRTAKLVTGQMAPFVLVDVEEVE